MTETKDNQATSRADRRAPAAIAILALEDVLIDVAAADPASPSSPSSPSSLGRTRLRPGAAAFLAELERARPRIPLALCTRMQHAAALTALAAAGLAPGRFFHIEAARGDSLDETAPPAATARGQATGRSGPGETAPPAAGARSGPLAGEAIERIVAAASAVPGALSGATSAATSAANPGANAALRVFFVCARPDDVDAAALAQTVLGDRATIVPVALRSRHAPVQALDRPGFALLADDLDQAGALVTTPVQPRSLGLVLLAYDEEASIAAAIADARRFGSLYFAGHEIVVVDDGSRDATAAHARACDQGDVRLVQHAENQGMGASMRDGYAAARTDLLAPLPADRQVRPASLIRFASYLVPVDGPADPMHVVTGSYEVPHSGQARQVMSVVFRVLVRHVGGYRVDLAGSYMFHRSLLDRVDARRTRSQSFLYSFQLLEQLRRLGCRFTRVTVTPFAREVGQSREATPRRIARMFVEIARARLESGL